MKLAIVAIAKNEEAFADRFLRSCVGADCVVVADTGSTDRTVHQLWRSWDELPEVKELRVEVVHISPWRFDIARNVALSLCPPDVDFCITLDMDEVLVNGWRGMIEKAIAQQPDCNRVAYGFIWNFNPDGTPRTHIVHNRIHSRNGYRWRYPCHETLERYAPGSDIAARVPGVLIEHHADDTKSRGSYLQLLELSVKENPHDRRAQMYLLREQLFTGGVTHSNTLMFGRWAVSQGFFVEGLHTLEMSAQLAESEGERVKSALALGQAHTSRKNRGEYDRVKAWLARNKV